MRFCSACGSRFSNDTRYCPIDGQPTIEQPEQVDHVDAMVGRVLDGRYRIERTIGEGGMGVVYLATHTALNKRMAVKVLRAEMARDQDVVQRFVQEAQASSAIGHPNIIDISDFGRLQDGSVFFVMEFLEGEPLTDRIARSKGLPVHEAIPILEQIASALSSAHASGIVHRDMKPDNVFLIQRGQTRDFVKVLDFGIAKVGGAASKLTKTGTVFGTPHYMSPEQAAGQSVDQRTDIYALGVIMYEMVTGEVPFDADTFMGILSKHMFEQPRPPTTLGERPELGALEPVILRALAKRPEHRYQSADDLIVDLATVRAGQRPAMPTVAMPVPNVGARAFTPAPQSDPYAGAVPMMSTAGGAMAVPMDGFGLSRRSVLSLLLAVFALLALGVIAGGAYAFTRPERSVTAAADHVPSAPAQTQSATPSTTPASPSLSAPSSPRPAAIAMVRIESTPPGATVTVDGATVGQTPVSLPKPAGADVRPIELTLDGYEPSRVLVTSGTAEILAVPLTSIALARRVEAPRPEAPARPASSPRAPATESVAPAPMVAPAAPSMVSDVIDPWE